MKKLISLDQLKVGTFIKIIGKNKKDTQTTCIKELIFMGVSTHRNGSDVEVLINGDNNYYFSFNAVMDGTSNWVKEVFILEGPDSIEEEKSLTDELADFFEEHKDIEISFQSKRNFTDPKKLSEYILELEGAVRHFSGKTLDVGLFAYRNRQHKYS